MPVQKTIVAQAIEAINKFKATNTMKEISLKTNISLHSLNHAYYRYFPQKIPYTAAAAARIKKIKCSPSPMLIPIIKKILKLKSKGLTYYQIAEQVNRSYASVWWAVNRHGKQHLPHKTSVDTIDSQPDDPDILVKKYVKKYQKVTDFNVTPTFLIKTHGLTKHTAARICQSLQNHA